MGGRNYNLSMGDEFAASRRVLSDAGEYRGQTDDMAPSGLGELFARRLIEISGVDAERHEDMAGDGYDHA